MKYQVVLVNDGAASAIDQIVADVGYSSYNYIIDCERNADEEWIRMLKSGVVLVDPMPYYIADGQDADSIYGDQNPVCLSEDEVRRLSQEWGRDLFQIMREASKEEIARFGCYD